MHKGPLTVTIVAWLFVAAGIVATAIHLKELAAPPIFHFEELWMPILALLPTVFGVFILLSQNWARWLRVVRVSFHVGISFFDSWQKMSVPDVLAALIGYILFRPTVTSYLHES